MKEHEPRTHQTFWCSECDANLVDSEKPETGKFFVHFGHAFNSETKEFDGDYVGVMSAICHKCLPVTS